MFRKFNTGNDTSATSPSAAEEIKNCGNIGVENVTTGKIADAVVLLENKDELNEKITELVLDTNTGGMCSDIEECINTDSRDAMEANNLDNYDMNFSSKILLEDTNVIPKNMRGYSRGANITIGSLEIIGGIVIASGSIIIATGINAVTGGTASIPAGYAVLGGWGTGSTLVAFGITRLGNTNNSKVSDDVKTVFVPAVVDIAQKFDKSVRGKK